MAKKIWTAAQEAFINAETTYDSVPEPVLKIINLMTFDRHLLWARITVLGNQDGMITEWWRKMKMIPGDVEWIVKNQHKAHLCRWDGTAYWHNLLVFPGDLSPTGVSLNRNAAIDEFKVLQKAVRDGKLNPLAPKHLPEEVVEELAAKIHDAWRDRERGWRKDDPAFLRVDISYAELANLSDGKELQQKDREPVIAGWNLFVASFPA